MKLHHVVFWAFIAFVGFGIAGSSVALAEKTKVAVTKIDSEGGTAVQEALAASLKGEMQLVNFKVVTKAAKKLSIDGLSSDNDFAKLAEALEAEVVIFGSLPSEGKLKIRLYVMGKKSKKFTVNFKNPKSETFKKIMHDTLIDKIRAINKSGDDEEPKATKKKPKDEVVDDEDPNPRAKKGGKKPKTDEEDALSTKKTTVDDEEDEEGKPRKKKKTARRGDDEELEEDPDAEMSVRATQPTHAANRVAVRIDAGISAANRTLDFNTRVYDQKPADYKNPVVPGARFTMEAFPFAFVDPKSRAAGLGFWGDYDKTISLQLASTNPDTGMVIRAKAIQQRYSIGGGYRFAFTRSDLSPTFTIGMNYGRRTFKADPAGLGGTMLDLPDVDYKMYQPIASLRIPIAKAFALVATGRGLLITEAGSITKADQYGQAKVFGVEASGGFDIIFSNRFAVRILGEFSQVGYTFTKGSGNKANNRDLDPNTKDVFGAADRSAGGTVTLGVLY